MLVFCKGWVLGALLPPGRTAFLCPDFGGGGVLGENLFCDGLELFVGDLEEVFAGFLGGGDVVVEKQAFTGPGGVGGGGFEGELGLGDGEALGAFELAGAGAVGGEVFGFAKNGFEILEEDLTTLWHSSIVRFTA